MATRGRKPKPSALKRAQGNPGKRRLNKAEPKPRVTRARADALPAASGVAAVEAELLRLGILTDVDRPAYNLMLAHLAIAQESRRRIMLDGLTVKDETGQQRKHPLLQVLRDNSAAFRSYAAEFGMTPSSRTRLAAPDAPPEKSLAELLFDVPVSAGEGTHG